MKNKMLALLVLGGGVLGVSGPALAHHGNAAYQDNVTEFKQAMVTKFLWSNPHSLIEFDVKDDKGKVTHWTAETASPEALKLIGWGKTSLEPGDMIDVFLYATKTGNPAGRLNRIIMSDGTILHDTQLGGDAGGKSGYGPDQGGNPGTSKPAK